VLRKADHDPKTPELFLSCGFPIAGLRGQNSRRDQDHEVETGEPGEICVRAPHVMTEYWKRPEQTAETPEERLAAYRRHRGAPDERGYMFILDRKKDMIVSGGFNIFPREGRGRAGRQHADVAMVAVVGVPDDKWGEAVTAVVVAREGRAAKCGGTDQTLLRPARVSAHAPSNIKFVTELPMTGGRQGRQESAEGGILRGRARAGWSDRLAHIVSPFSTKATSPVRVGSCQFLAFLDFRPFYVACMLVCLKNRRALGISLPLGGPSPLLGPDAFQR